MPHFGRRGRYQVPADSATAPLSLYWLAELRKALDVTRDEIDFEVQTRPGGQPAERRHGKGVRNQIDSKARPIYFVDGQTHAIECDRTLAGDVASERLRRMHREAA